MTMAFSGIQAAEAIVWYLLIGGIASAARTWLSRSKVRRVISGVTGAVFVFFAVQSRDRLRFRYASLRGATQPPVGGMFWFRWKTLSGSHTSFRAVRRANLSGG